jgi:regulator of nucleoside diphosphate kinase
LYVLTTDSIPFDVTVKDVFAMIESTYPVEISKKGFLRSITEANKNDHQLAYDSFVAGVRNTYPQANFVIGTKVSTAVGSFNNGTFLYITYIGTPVFAE